MVINYKIHLLLILFCIPLFILAQDQKDEFSNWYSINNIDLSENGKWSYFFRNYDGRREGVLLNTNTKHYSAYISPTEYYLDDHTFIIRTKNDSLFKKDLITNKEFVFANAVGFSYDPVSGNLVVRKKEKVELFNKSIQLLKTFPAPEKFIPTGINNLVIMFYKDSLNILNPSTGMNQCVLFEILKNKIVKTNLEKAQKCIQFVQKYNDHYYVILVDSTGKLLLNKKLDERYNDYEKFDFTWNNFLIATKKALKFQKADTIEIWSNNDKGIKPLAMECYSSIYDALIYDINNKKEYFNKAQFGITRKHLLFNNRYVLEVMALENEDFTTASLRPKIQLRNLLTDEIEFTEDTIQANCYFCLRDRGPLFYFKDKDWWMYDAEKKEKTNITQNLPDKFWKPNRLNYKNLFPFDIPVFSKDQKSIYLTSENDIWEYNFINKKAKLLTHNKDKNLSYQIINSSYEGTKDEPFDLLGYRIMYDPYLLLLISKKNSLDRGLALFKDGKIKIVNEPESSSFSGIHTSNNIITYVKENANQPFQLLNYNIRDGISKIIYQSNLSNFNAENFPKTNLRFWINNDGDSIYLSVTLPVGYNPEKKYPTIIWIYEDEAKQYCKFDLPTWYNSSAFNRSLMAFNDYIVLQPSISYKPNEAGQSALLATEKAIDEALKYYSIDTTRLGICGGSFGGYETNYIITRTDKFKAAFSFSSVTDIMKQYFHISEYFTRPEIWRFTDQQARYNGSFFELKKEYINNNPIFFADKINTPLLLVAGKKDTNVEWEQSVRMFVALASLKKDVKMLLYPDEGHTFTNPRNQKDIAKKFLEWFNYYLKGAPVPDWVY